MSSFVWQVWAHLWAHLLDWCLYYCRIHKLIFCWLKEECGDLSLERSLYLLFNFWCMTRFNLISRWTHCLVYKLFLELLAPCPCIIDPVQLLHLPQPMIPLMLNKWNYDSSLQCFMEMKRVEVQHMFLFSSSQVLPLFAFYSYGKHNH